VIFLYSSLLAANKFELERSKKDIKKKWINFLIMIGI